MKGKLARAKARKQLLAERLEAVIQSQDEPNEVKKDVFGAAASLLIGAMAPPGETPIVVEQGGKPIRFTRQEIRSASRDVLDRHMTRLMLRGLDYVAEGMKKAKDGLRQA